MSLYMKQSIAPCVLLPVSSRSSKQFAIYDYFWHQVCNTFVPVNILYCHWLKCGCNWRQRKRGIHTSSKRADTRSALYIFWNVVTVHKAWLMCHGSVKAHACRHARTHTHCSAPPPNTHTHRHTATLSMVHMYAAELVQADLWRMRRVMAIWRTHPLGVMKG